MTSRQPIGRLEGLVSNRFDRQPGHKAHLAGRVAVLSAFASVASIVAPPVLGIAAEQMGARHALMLVGIGVVASIALARTVRRDAPDVARTVPPVPTQTRSGERAVRPTSGPPPASEPAGLVRPYRPVPAEMVP